MNGSGRHFCIFIDSVFWEAFLFKKLRVSRFEY